jgi:pilus assembly protein Flp/PilA
MRSVSKTFARLLKDESGATAIEYGLIAALIAAVIITAVTAIGTNLNDTFTTISKSVGAAGSGASS